MDKVKILPFVGTSYGNNNIFGKSIMVLGESQYGQFSPSLTRDVVSLYLNPNIEREAWMNTLLKFERSLVNKETSRQDSVIIWNSLLFYNYIQTVLDDPRTTPTAQMFHDSKDAFFEVLEQYKPELIIVWGKRLWKNLPNENWEDGEEIPVDGYSVDNGYYNLKNGHRVRVVCVYHPSTGYSWDFWYKVLSRFVETSTSKAIGGVGFSNFRRYTSFPTIELGGVNILVGANNAGKSTFDKGAILCLHFLKNWISGKGTTINFSSEICKELGFTSYKDIYSSFAYKGEDMILEMTIGRYHYTVFFYEPKSKNADSIDELLITAYKVCVTDLKDNNAFYSFDYSCATTTVLAQATLPVLSPSTLSLDEAERFVNSPMCTLDSETRDEIYSLIDSAKEDITSLSFTDNKIIDTLSKIIELLGEDVPSEIISDIKMLSAIIIQVCKEENEISVETHLPRMNTVKDWLHRLKKINEIQPEYDEGRENNIGQREINYIPMIEPSFHKTYATNEDHSLARVICDYARMKKTKEVNAFVSKWLKEFKIGSEVSFECLEQETYACYITSLDSQCKMLLSSLGLGSLHLTALLLNISSYILKSGAFNSRALIVEEPEINLHPNRQSQLADFFYDIYKTFGIQVIVVTHSEYLVRKMQVIAASEIKRGVYYTNELNGIIKVYYFPGQGNPYSMFFKTSGVFTREFGEGFLDEAWRSYQQLIKIERGLL